MFIIVGTIGAGIQNLFQLTLNASNMHLFNLFHISYIHEHLHCKGFSMFKFY